VIDGFVAAATVPGVEGKTIDLGSGTLIPLRDIVNRLVAIIGMTSSPNSARCPTGRAKTQNVRHVGRCAESWTVDNAFARLRVTTNRRLV
jgi:hypothetical protein